MNVPAEPAPTPTPTPAPAPAKSNGVPMIVLLVVAVGLVLVYMVFLWVLFGAADDTGIDETVWGRYTFILGGLEAIVFTAVGWLFGREVNRKQAEQAEKATEQAKNATGEAEKAKADGRALQNAILAAPEAGEFEGASEKASLGQLRGFARTFQF